MKKLGHVVNPAIVSFIVHSSYWIRCLRGLLKAFYMNVLQFLSDSYIPTTCTRMLRSKLLTASIDHQVAEERRLLYVAVTRAKKKCYLTATKRRHLWGRIKEPKPTRFLDPVFEAESKSEGAKVYIDHLGVFD